MFIWGLCENSEFTSADSRYTKLHVVHPWPEFATSAESVPDHFYSSLLSLSWTNERGGGFIYNSFLRGINFSSSRANKKRQFHFLSTRSSTFALAVHFFHRRPHHEFASAQKCIWFKCIASRDEARGAAWATLCYTLALALAVIPSWGRRARSQTFAYGRRQPQSTLRVYAACCCCSTQLGTHNIYIMRTTTKSGEYLSQIYVWWLMA